MVQYVRLSLERCGFNSCYRIYQRSVVATHGFFTPISRVRFPALVATNSSIDIYLLNKIKRGICNLVYNVTVTCPPFSGDILVRFQLHPCLHSLVVEQWTFNPLAGVRFPVRAYINYIIHIG